VVGHIPEAGPGTEQHRVGGRPLRAAHRYTLCHPIFRRLIVVWYPSRRLTAAAPPRAVTSAPDGTRWIGLSAVRVAADQGRRGHARARCPALPAWGAEKCATRGYVQVLTGDHAAIARHESMGFS
jgi:hypothetical protein